MGPLVLAGVLVHPVALVDELIDGEALLFASPLYNFGVSQHFKNYIDLIFTDPRMAAGTEPLLAGIRDVLVNANFGSASLAIKDSAFAYNLAQAKPSGIPFDPNA